MLDALIVEHTYKYAYKTHIQQVHYTIRRSLHNEQKKT